MNDKIEIGKSIPDFTLESTSGNSFSLKDLKGKIVVLYFYPRDNTAGCTTEALEFSALKEAFEKKNTVIIGISKDSIKSHHNFINKHELSFELLSDPDKKIHENFDVLKLKKNYGKETLGTERSTFIINQEGILVKEYRKVKAKGHAQEVLEFIKEHL